MTISVVVSRVVTCCSERLIQQNEKGLPAMGSVRLDRDSTRRVRASSLAGMTGTLLLTLGYLHLGALPGNGGIVLLLAVLWLLWLPTSVVCFAMRPTKKWFAPIRIALGLSLGAAASGFHLLA
jgi:hypothetical protein